MDRPTSSQLKPAFNGLSNIRGTFLAESGATGQVFSRMVIEVGQPVASHDMTDQSTSSDNQGYLNPEKEWLKDFAVQNQTGYKDSPAIPLAIPLENYQVAKYDPENNPFSIYSLTKGVQSTDENSSHIECQRKLRKNPAKLERVRERERKYQRERYQTDHAYAERKRARGREHLRKLRKDPAYLERERERLRELRKDPVFLERQRKRQREYHKKRQRELRKDPVLLERQRQYQREYQRERKRKLRKDPVFLERQKQCRQSVNSAKNSDDLPLTSNLAETTQGSSKNSEGTAPRFSVVKLKEYLQSRSTHPSL